MTMGDYLTTLQAQPLVDGSDPMEWRDDAWRASDEEAIPPGHIYGVLQRVAASDEAVFNAGHGVMANLLDVRLYQKADADGRTPRRAGMIRAYYLLLQAPQLVDAAPMHQTFEGLTLDPFRIPPSVDPNRLDGLTALVRYTEYVRY